jgi:hypothetical protein
MQIEQRKVAGVVTETNAALAGKGFNTGEILVGLAELIGRVIVESGSTTIQMDDMHKVVHDHIKHTMIIGAQATGKLIIPGR